jgi:hypothetical protein
MPVEPGPNRSDGITHLLLLFFFYFFSFLVDFLIFVDDPSSI